MRVLVTGRRTGYLGQHVCADVVIARTPLILGDGNSQHERLVSQVLSTRLRGAGEFW